MSPGFSDTRAALFPPLHTASCGADTVGDTGCNFASIGDVHFPNSAHYTTEKSRSNVTTVAIHTPSSHSLVSKHGPSAKEARTLGRKADSQLGQDKTNVSLKQVSTVLNI